MNIDQELEKPWIYRAGFWTVLVSLELILLALYLAATPGTGISPRYLIYPFIWINLGIWGSMKVYPSGDELNKPLLVISVLYIALLLWITGMIGLDSLGTGLDITAASPGWGPIITYSGSWMYIRFIPFMYIGYVSLGYLVYASLNKPAKTLIGGAVSVFSCFGCMWPVVTALLSTIPGTATGLSAALPYSMDLSTLAFAISIALLIYLPRYNRVDR